MGEAVVAGALAGYGIAIPVGAVAILIVGTGIRRGFLVGVGAGAGAATADLLYALLAVTAGGAVSRLLAPWEGEIRWGSSLLLAMLGVWGLVHARAAGKEAPDATGSSSRELGGTYLRFLGLTVVNPLTVVYFTALVVGTTAGSSLGVADGAVFALGAFAASLSWQTLLAALGAFGRRGLGPRARLAAVVVGNLLILAMAWRMAMN